MKLIRSTSIPSQSVNHPGSMIQKKVLIENGVIPSLSKFALATFKPGESTPSHIHKTMYEIFFVDRGSIIFTVSSKKIELQKGDCLIIKPHEPHSVINTGTSPAHLIYFGITH